MHIYKNIPAFGFETAKCNATEHYQDMLDKVDDTQKINAKVFEAKVSNSGSDSAIEYTPINSTEAAKAAWKIANFTKILGYIPLVGTLIGLCRIAKATNTTKELLPNKVNHIARGCVELLSLGFLLILPDLILTGYRLSQSNSSGSEYTPIKT